MVAPVAKEDDVTDLSCTVFILFFIRRTPISISDSPPLFQMACIIRSDST